VTARDSIVVSGVDKTYRGPAGPVPALAGVDLDLPRGVFTALVGPTGCGKSTLLRLVAGLDTPDSGSVTVFGQSPRAAAARKAIGVVPQSPALLPWLSVEANVRLPLRVNARAERARRDAGAAPRPDPVELLRRVGLGDALARRPHELSGGMRQRVAVVRAFALQPEVLLLDEPFSAVDELTREALQLQLLELWQATRTTVLFVTHSVREAVTLADRVVVMGARPGHVASTTTVDLPRPRDARVLLDPRMHAHEDDVRQQLLRVWSPAAGTGAPA
jgi:NitT/TauT family transport system ATP-binding protein